MHQIAEHLADISRAQALITGWFTDSRGFRFSKPRTFTWLLADGIAPVISYASGLHVWLEVSRASIGLCSDLPQTGTAQSEAC